MLNDMETWEKKQVTREPKKKEIVQTEKAKTSIRSARDLVKQGEHFKAMQLLEQVLAEEPEQLEAQELLSQVKGHLQDKKVKTSVRSARDLVKQGEHFKALQLLEQVLAEEPGQLEAQELLFQVQGHLERQTNILLHAGDTLYRDGKIEAAMNNWRAVLKINPELEVAREKIQRAQKVLDNLQLLREEKTVSETKQPTSSAK